MYAHIFPSLAVPWMNAFLSRSQHTSVTECCWGFAHLLLITLPIQVYANVFWCMVLYRGNYRAEFMSWACALTYRTAYMHLMHPASWKNLWKHPCWFVLHGAGAFAAALKLALKADKMLAADPIHNAWLNSNKQDLNLLNYWKHEDSCAARLRPLSRHCPCIPALSIHHYHPQRAKIIPSGALLQVVWELVLDTLYFWTGDPGLFSFSLSSQSSCNLHDLLTSYHGSVWWCCFCFSWRSTNGDRSTLLINVSGNTPGALFWNRGQRQKKTSL